MRKLPITPSSFDFKELMSSSSKATLRSEEGHSQLESIAFVINQSQRFRASNSQDLVYFIKNGLDLPFGPKTGGSL